MARKKIRPQFHNQDLQKAFDTHAPGIERFRADQDAFSRDILNFEKLLAENGICVPVSIQIGAPVEWVPAKEVYADPPPESAGGSFLVPGFEAFRETETLEWSQIEGDGRWRIRYRLTRECGNVSTPPDREGQEVIWPECPGVVMCRPLIETPVAIRVKARPALRRLLEAISAEISRGLPKPVLSS